MNVATNLSLAVDIQSLGRTFRGKPALADVTLQVPTGTVFGLVGLNGAGKTTLIRHLIGSLKAQTGRVRVLGDDPVGDPEGVLKRVGYLTEEDSLPRWMTVGELIDFTRAIYPTWDQAYADELCELFTLSRPMKLRSLSKGGRARAGLLAAIAHRPQLLVLDEPSSGLDPIARRDILEAIIRTINDDGRTVFFSSHLLDEVDRVCDSVALMHEGRIVETVDSDSLASRFVELVFRFDPSQTSPPKTCEAWGWRRSGNEWSAVASLDTTGIQDWPPGCNLIETRPLSLQRWFDARVSSQTFAPEEATDV